jgi:hypothetical protein
MISTRQERERFVLDLYYNQGKNTRERLEEEAEEQQEQLILLVLLPTNNNSAQASKLTKSSANDGFLQARLKSSLSIIIYWSL